MQFQFKNSTYPIKITYLEALKVLPEKYGINLCKMFTDSDAAAKTMEHLALDDEKTLDLAWHYVEPTASFDKDEFLTIMESKDLERFREDFWAAVVNFSGPLKKNLLMELWSQFKKDIKKAEFQSETLNASPSDSSPGE